MSGRKEAKTVFVCQGCAYQAPKWLGKCPECGEWNTLVEERQSLTLSTSQEGPVRRPEPVPIGAVEMAQQRRVDTGIQEFDRVLGGGLVPGSLILVGGDPGIGKSTLMLQVLHRLADGEHKVLYISGRNLSAS